jgi:hypothetical protein
MTKARQSYWRPTREARGRTPARVPGASPRLAPASCRTPRRSRQAPPQASGHMALHEFQIAEVDIENASRLPLLVDQLDDHPALISSCVIANDTFRSNGVLSYRAHQAYEIEPPRPLRRLVTLIHSPHLCAEDRRGSRGSHGRREVMASTNSARYRTRRGLGVGTRIRFPACKQARKGGCLNRAGGLRSLIASLDRCSSSPSTSGR